MEELSLDNILSDEQFNDLFPEETKENVEESDDKENSTTEVDSSTLFEEDTEEPESVGSEEKNITEDKDKEDTSPEQKGSSPNFYSSIANALLEEGIFQDLDDTSKIQTAEDFADAMNQQIQSRLDDVQKRVAEALENGVEPTEIQKYENYMRVLDSISEEKLNSESEEGENLRKNLIYQDCINRGYSKDKAMKMVDRFIKDGTDVDEAKEALQSNKEFFSSAYKKVLDEAKQQEQLRRETVKKEAEKLKTSILTENKAFGEIELDKQTRQKVYDTIMRPSYKDPDTGEQLTELQKYESENKLDFLKNVGLIYVLTDGFKKLDNLVKGKVKKEVKKGLKELEHTINSTSRNTDGSLNFLSGSNDPNSKYSGWSLNI